MRYFPCRHVLYTRAVARPASLWHQSGLGPPAVSVRFCSLTCLLRTRLGAGLLPIQSVETIPKRLARLCEGSKIGRGELASGGFERCRPLERTAHWWLSGTRRMRILLQFRLNEHTQASRPADNYRGTSISVGPSVSNPSLTDFANASNVVTRVAGTPIPFARWTQSRVG